MGQRMHKIAQSEKQSSNGKTQIINHYRAANCKGCPLKGTCFKAKGNRLIKVSLKSRQYQNAARKRLEALKGQRKRKQRNIDVEPVFGHIKQNRGFRRFTLRDLDGVNIEMGLLLIAHNFKKWHTKKTPSEIPLPKIKQANSNALSIPLQKSLQVKKVA